MASERENTLSNSGLGRLNARRYVIDGDTFRAFFDATGGLVFVIDDTDNPGKPNAMLLIDRVSDRKWDDILSNDYGVQLEYIRPKKDNKYQKLDIEYDGLDEYATLILDYETGADIAAPLDAMRRWRAGAIRRVATARLAAATDAADAAQQTIVRTNDAVADMDSRIKSLRSKLGRQRTGIGREPTKQSAAKILRTESQIDALKDKRARAMRRLDNARRRMNAAEQDADAARAVLAYYDNNDNVDVVVEPELPVRVAAPNVPAVQDAPHVPTVIDTDVDDPLTGYDDTDDEFDIDPGADVAGTYDKIIKQPEPKAREMAEDEVKPLFDKDPEILDEEIAFKPIDFTADTAPVTPVSQPQSAAPAPLSFAPPADADVSRQPAQNSAPVLDTLTAVDQQPEYRIPDPAPAPAAPAPFVDETLNRPQPQPYGAQPATADPAPMDRNYAAAPVAETPRPVAPARPVSPSGSAVRATPVQDTGVGGGKSNILYYGLLVVLIVLSIFTLWLYQHKNADKTPDLAGTSKPDIEASAPAAANTDASDEDPFGSFDAEPVTVEPEPVAEPEPVIEPEPVAEPEPIIDETAPFMPVAVEPDPEPVPQDDDDPFIELQDTAPVAEPEPEPVPQDVNKPEYNVGATNDNMFVADAEYDDGESVSDTVVIDADVAAPVVEPEPAITQTVVVSDDTPVIEPEPVYYESEQIVEEPTSLLDVDTEYAPNAIAAPAADTCEDGTMPDADGCCGDETYQRIANGYACCSESTGSCFPPIK